METLDLVGEGGQALRGERSAVQHGARVADHPGHVPHELVRRADIRARSVLTEIVGRSTQGLLRAVRERSEKMLEQKPRWGQSQSALGSESECFWGQSQSFYAHVLSDHAGISMKAGCLATVVALSLGGNLSGSVVAAQANGVAPAPLPNPTGPHRVGVRRLHWTDTSRRELGTTAGEPRALVVRVWYPTTDATGTIDEYLPSLGLYRAAGSVGPRTAERLAAVRSASLLDASLAPGARHPIVIFSPGNGEMEHVYTSLAQEFASHGYLFALVVHTGVSDVVYPDGRSLRRYARLYDPKPAGSDAALPPNGLVNLRRALYDTLYTEAAQYLRADISFIIDRFAQEDASAASPFRGRLDLARIATFGHSYGGNIAVEACARDARVKACLQTDGGAFGPVRDEGLSKPYMILRPAFINDGPPRGLAQSQLLGTLRSGGYEINVEGATHRSFMDAHFIDPSTRGDAIAAERVLAITSAYARAFLGKHLRDRDSALLIRRSPEFPEVHLRTVGFDFGRR